MTSFVHTNACTNRQLAFQKAVAEYNEKWPNHCKKCGGHSGRSYPATYNDPGDFEECSDCICQGRCPRCGDDRYYSDWETDSPCKNCGWTYKDGGAPEPPDCECHEMLQEFDDVCGF